MQPDLLRTWNIDYRIRLGVSYGVGTFYFAAPQNDWTTPQNDALWQDGVKTLFDPCPAGWRVPKSGTGELSPWSAFSAGNSILNDPDGGSVWGRSWDTDEVHGGSAWYPARGIRTNTGVMGYLNASYHWTSTMAATIPYRFRFDRDVVMPENVSSAGNCEGTSVRCIRE